MVRFSVAGLTRCNRHGRHIITKGGLDAIIDLLVRAEKLLREATDQPDPSAPRTLYLLRAAQVHATLATATAAAPIPPGPQSQAPPHGAPASSTGVLTAWRVCSGFAHGRLWATLAVLQRDEVVDLPTLGDVGLRVTNSLDRLIWATMAAVDVVDTGLRLYRKRAASPYVAR